MKFAFLLIVLAAFVDARALLSQPSSDSLRREESIARERPELPFAASARMRLLRQLKSGDISSARDLLLFMNRRATPDATTWLTPQERLVVETIIADVELLRDTMRLAVLLAPPLREGESAIHADRLLATLREIVRHQSEGLAARLDANAPDPEERFFFNLLLNHIYTRGYRAQERLNDLVSDFVARYPTSQLIPLAERYIRKGYGEEPFGMAFNAGYTIGEFSGGLGDRFNYFHGPVIAGEFYIHRFTFAAWLNFGVAKGPQDFIAGGRRWSGGSSPFTNITLDLGWEFRFGRLGVTPLAGMAIQSLRGIDSTGAEGDRSLRTGDRIGVDIGVIVGYRIPFDVGPHIDLRARLGRSSAGLDDYDVTFSGALWYMHFGFALVQRPYRGR